MQAGVQVLHAAAHVANAHGAGICIAVHLAERLYLHGADKADQHIGQPVQIVGDKANNKQQCNLNQQNQLAPVESLHQVVAVADALGKIDTGGKGQQRQKIPQRFGKITLAKIGGHQHDIAGLSVGKNLAAAHVGVSVLKSAGQG